MPIWISYLNIAVLAVAVYLWLGIVGKGHRLQGQFLRAGLSNHKGEAPLLRHQRKDVEHPNVSILTFSSTGIPLAEWEKRCEKIETALNIEIADIRQGKDKRTILVYAVQHYQFPEKLPWQDSNQPSGNAILALGENAMGQVTYDLSKIPHILLGGSTGSGKSVLLKLLLMQALQKNHTVCIADFKGGVDFAPHWHQSCRMIFDEEDLLEVLTTLTDELTRRKELLKASGQPNLDDYNSAPGATLSRMIFACDEVAEVLDKSGRSKEQKELIGKIEQKLSIIARQGRAFGLHLILATQRPDATVISGQIRSNLDCRICGRADQILSQIILDSTSASEKIPKTARGRFLMADGTLFQAYWQE